ncbi:hypothetical protein DN412_05960 [Cupriavidus lacunae]|uniref:Uncharacterized protein n=1 Tax=Cupriavidus lacunae TaxID=2666307 RepID=A0A370P0I6_9BURK|nr:hypothetical protein DN412_05960 [Cupriavidus lacunae]
MTGVSLTLSPSIEAFCLRCRATGRSIWYVICNYNVGKYLIIMCCISGMALPGWNLGHSAKATRWRSGTRITARRWKI